MAHRTVPAISFLFVVVGLAVLAGIVFFAIARSRERRRAAAGAAGEGAGPAGGLVILILFVVSLFAIVIVSLFTVTVREERRHEIRRAEVTRAEVYQSARDLKRLMEPAGQWDRPAAGTSQVPQSSDGVIFPSSQAQPPRPGSTPPTPSAVPEAQAPSVNVPRPPRPPQVTPPSPPQPPVEVVPPEAIEALRDSLAAPDAFPEWKKAEALEVIGSPATQKPWVSDAAGSSSYVATILGLRVEGRHPGPDGQIAAYSGLEPDPEAALEAAREEALRGIGSLVISQAYGSGAPASASATVILEALAALGTQVENHLEGAVLDRYAQSLRGKTGNVYHRAALLLEADPTSLEPLVGSLRDRVASILEAKSLKRRELILAVASALGLAFVVFLLYSFLNAGTKGHFAWPLRFVSLGALIILYVGLMYLQGWFR